MFFGEANLPVIRDQKPYTNEMKVCALVHLQKRTEAGEQNASSLQDKPQTNTSRIQGKFCTNPLHNIQNVHHGIMKTAWYLVLP